MDRDKILIGVMNCGEQLKNEQDIAALKNSGFDFAVAAADKGDLDLCEKQDFEVISTLNFPLLQGGCGENAGKYKNGSLVKKLEEGNKEIMEHKALSGDYICDGIHSWDFEYLNKIMKKYAKLYPEKICFANIGSADENYEEYVEKYVEAVENDYICLKTSPFGENSHDYLEKLDIASAACRRDFRDLWVIMQSERMTESQLRLQSNVALLYGADIIIHSDLCSDLDAVSKVNGEVQSFSDTFKNFTNVCVAPTGKIHAACPEMKAQLIEQAKRNDYFEGIENVSSIRSNSALLAGYFEKFNGDGSAVMLVNVTNPADPNHVAEVEIDVPQYKLSCVFVDGTETVHLTSDRTIKVSLPTGSAAFVTVRKDRRY